MSFFSIIIPAYNRASFLQPLIKSIQQQEFQDFEILIVDDGSSDDSQSVIEAEMLREPRLRYIHQENSERGAARNTGIRNAKGNFMLFIDSDDLMLPTYLSDLYNLIQNKPGYNFYSGRYFFNLNGRLLKTSSTGLPSGEHTINTMLKGNPFGCNFCVRRDHKGLKLFNEDRNLATTEDWIFLVENLYSDKLFLGDFVGLHMVQHDGRSMQENQKIIDRRINATKVLEEKLPFTANQKKELWAYTWSFCGTHAYLDENREQSLSFIRKAIKTGGNRTYFLKLYVKFFLGRSFTSKIKRITG